MLDYTFMGYELDPYYAADYLAQLWQSEPVGMVSILVSFTGLVLTLSYKLIDLWWDTRKEKARQGKLRIELVPLENGCKAVIANIGKEPVVLREVGFLKRGFFWGNWTHKPTEAGTLPKTLNARELVEIPLQLGALQTDTTWRFAVRDSLGKVWETPNGEMRRMRRALKPFLQVESSVARETV